MAAGNQWKHLEFTLALSKCLFSLLNLKTFAQALLSKCCLLRTRKHKANRYFRARNMHATQKLFSLQAPLINYTGSQCGRQRRETLGTRLRRPSRRLIKARRTLLPWCWLTTPHISRSCCLPLSTTILGSPSHNQSIKFISLFLPSFFCICWTI